MPISHAAAVRGHITVPEHIAAIASAVRFDLLYGPTYLLIPKGDLVNVNDDCVSQLRDDLEVDEKAGDVVEETYVGTAAAALRDFIDDLPSDLWFDTNAEDISEKEPEGEEVDGEWCEPTWEDWRKLDRGDVVEAIFGHTIATEFR